MRFWIDLSTPKEVIFFRTMVQELEQRGHDVILTTRKYTETNDLIKYFGLNAEIMGKHGETRSQKLKEGIRRLDKLYNRFKDEKIDGVITLVNPETCRVAFGLGFPLFNFIDITEATIVCKLTLPLSRAVFIPFHVPMKELKKYWNGELLYVYNCLDPIAWMPKTPVPEAKLGLEKQYLDQDGRIKHPFIVCRTAETKATYFRNHKDLTTALIIALKNLIPEATFYEVPRYKEHRMIDLQSLLYYTDLFIGGGGTITEEACYWGTWSISCRPFSSSYDKWLEETGNLIRVKSITDGCFTALEMLKRQGKNPAHKIIRKQKFPLKEICNFIEEKI